MRAVPQAAIDLAKSYEGFRPSRYLDVAGNPTIGYGHLLALSDPLWNAAISEVAGEELLLQDMDTRAAGPLCEDLGDALANSLTEGQYAALCDFVFNEGIGHWHGSTLRSMVFSRQFSTAPGQFVKWVYAGGQVSQGLIRRRAAEVALWGS